MRKILFLYNPIAGQAKVRKRLYEIADYYDQHDYLVTLCPTKKLKKYYEELGIIDEHYDKIVCCGGDGTLNMVVSFFLERKMQVDIGYIPAGSTNDYAYSIGVPSDFHASLENTLTGVPRQIDIGRFNGKYFLYVAAFGAFTKVSYSTSQKTKNLLGHTAYILEGIKQLSDVQSYHLTVETDCLKVQGNFILGLVTNSLSVGGFKNILPRDVSMDDGKFEVLLIKMPDNILELHGIMSALLGERLGSNDKIIYTKTSQVHMQSEENIAWTLDGEYGGKINESIIENVPCAFSMICEQVKKELC